jgi:hypothetical protein
MSRYLMEARTTVERSSVDKALPYQSFLKRLLLPADSIAAVYSG